MGACLSQDGVIEQQKIEAPAAEGEAKAAETPPAANHLQVMSIQPLKSMILAYLDINILLQLPADALQQIKSYHKTTKSAKLNLNVKHIKENEGKYVDFLLDFQRYEKINLTFDWDTTLNVHIENLFVELEKRERTFSIDCLWFYQKYSERMSITKCLAKYTGLIDLFKLTIHGELGELQNDDGEMYRDHEGKEKDKDHDDLELEVNNVFNQVSKVQYDNNDCFEAIEFKTDHDHQFVLDYGFEADKCMEYFTKMVFKKEEDLINAYETQQFKNPLYATQESCKLRMIEMYLPTDAYDVDGIMNFIQKSSKLAVIDVHVKDLKGDQYKERNIETSLTLVSEGKYTYRFEKHGVTYLYDKDLDLTTLYNMFVFTDQEDIKRNQITIHKIYEPEQNGDEEHEENS